MRYRALLLAFLVYLTADLALPSMAGSFVFDPDDSVDSAQGRRLRPDAEVLDAPALTPGTFTFQVARADRAPRRASASLASLARPAARDLPRASLDSRSSDDPH